MIGQSDRFALATPFGLAFLAMLGTSNAAAGQSRQMHGAKPIKVTVRVSSVRLTGDTVELAYVVENRAKPASGEDLWSFMVDAPARPIGVDTPRVAGLSWKTRAEYRDKPAADWTLRGDRLISPGQSTPPLTARARGVTDLVRYWAVPDLFTNPIIGDEDEGSGGDDGFKAFADTGRTIGVVPLPVRATTADLAALVRRFLDYSCGTRQLITSANLCGSLGAALDSARSGIAAGNNAAARQSISTLLSQLTAARGAAASEAAYALLRSNSDYLLTRLR